jgi:hypothetical protein
LFVVWILLLVVEVRKDFFLVALEEVLQRRLGAGASFSR